MGEVSTGSGFGCVSTISAMGLSESGGRQVGNSFCAGKSGPFGLCLFLRSGDVCWDEDYSADGDGDVNVMVWWQSLTAAICGKVSPYLAGIPSGLN